MLLRAPRPSAPNASPLKLSECSAWAKAAVRSTRTTCRAMSTTSVGWARRDRLSPSGHDVLYAFAYPTAEERRAIRYRDDGRGCACGRDPCKEDLLCRSDERVSGSHRQA